MVAKTEQQGSTLDTVKLIISLLILVSAIVAYYYFGSYSHLLRVLGLLALVGVAVFVASTTLIGKAGIGFLRGSRAEVRKVVWPTRQETIQTTIAVLVMVLIVAIMLWLVDMFLGWAVRSLLT